MSRTARARRDSGMTLPELLITISIMGLLVTVIAGAISVSLGSYKSAEGRLNVAVAEQNVDLWLPTDLASASSVSTNPVVTPCGVTVCGGVDFSTGSTALLLSWTNRVGSDASDVVTTVVAYLFAPSASGDGTYSLTRVECIDGTCTSHVMLRGLTVPLDADGLPLWHPGDAVPSEVIHVTNPLRFEDGLEMSDAENAKNARRVVVTINGGGTGAANGGGTNTISVTAGGTTRGNLPAKAAYQMPSLVQPRSRCGGPIVLIVDESQSLGADGVKAVKQGVVDFIEALDGTPVQLMIVPFNSFARSLGGDNGANWHKYWDMSDPTQVSQVKKLAKDQIEMSGGGGTGYTNWEDAWFRTFYNKDGSPGSVLPNSVVFFTDGVPNRDRAFTGGTYKQDTAPNTALPPGNWGTGNNYHWGNSATNFSNGAFKRAEAIAAEFRGAVKLIGVAVGPDITKSNPLVTGSTPVWESIRNNSDATRPWQQSTNSGSSWQGLDNFSTYSAAVDGFKPNGTADSKYMYRQNPAQNTSTKANQTNGWKVEDGGPPSSWSTASGNTFYQLRGERTVNSDIVGRLVGGPVIEEFRSDGQGGFENLDDGNLFKAADWAALGPALQKIALGQCGGTVNIQTRLGSTTGPNVSTTINFLKAAEYYDVAGTQPVPDALVGTTVSTNGVQKIVTIDMNLKDGLDRYIDIVPQGVVNLATVHFSKWACRSGPNEVPMSPVDVISNGQKVLGWEGVRVRVKANQAVSCTLVVT